MPAYDYKCLKCGIFELEQPIKADPLKNCPKCGSPIQRMISSSGIVFKGPGFYKTDYKKDGLHETRPMGKLPEAKEVNKGPKPTKNS